MQVSIQNPEKILERLDWTVIRLLDGLLQGDYRTLFHGFGLELAELREYEISDDVRYIDWNVTARMQTPYVRQYIEDRELTAWFLLDVSPSLDFGTTNTLKRNMLIELTAILARLLTRHHNRVGMIVYDGKIETLIPPKSGRLQVLYLINNLLNQARLKFSEPTDLTLLFQTALGLIRRRSLIFIISDFISKPGWEKSLSLLAQKHEIITIRLYDPRERELPDIGPMVFEDAETGEQLYIDTHDKNFRKRFVDAASRRDYEVNVILRRLGIDSIELSTEDDIAREIIRFTKTRKQRKKTPAIFAAASHAK